MLRFGCLVASSLRTMMLACLVVEATFSNPQRNDATVFKATSD